MRNGGFDSVFNVFCSLFWWIHLPWLFPCFSLILMTWTPYHLLPQHFRLHMLPNPCLATPPFVCLGCTRPNCHMRSLQNGSTPSTPLLFQVRAAAEAAGSDMLEISPMAKGGVSKSYVQNRGRGVHQNGKSHVENDQPGRFWGFLG